MTTDVRVNETRSHEGKFELFYAVLPPLFWAGNFLLARLLRNEIPPLQMSFWRWLIALAILAPFAWPGVRGHMPSIRKELPFLALLGLVGTTAFNCFVYVALHYTTVVNAALINSFMPVMTFIFAYFLLGQKLRGIQLFGIVVSIAGAVVVILRGNITDLSVFSLNLGDFLVLCGLSCWALYTVLIRLRPSSLPLSSFLFVTTAFGTVFHLPLVLIEYPMIGGFQPDAGAVISLFYLAVFPSLLAYIFWNRAVVHYGPGRAAMFMHLMPVFSAILAMIFLGEQLRPYHGVGLVCIVAGITLVTRSAKVRRNDR
ncbi:DMT family transporter [Pusillimonas sp.]|uniref:DMT family transporter n=1 Tax=Pusillimonas sp. TaxID=3040095 RepID=UPI0029B14262|nr:DMT family transporter [Pusillimonas sp.]MDX3896232.1 DMT family transporter [Pusillimonas sp.]